MPPDRKIVTYPHAKPHPAGDFPGRKPYSAYTVYFDSGYSMGIQIVHIPLGNVLVHLSIRHTVYWFFHLFLLFPFINFHFSLFLLFYFWNVSCICTSIICANHNFLLPQSNQVSRRWNRVESSRCFCTGYLLYPATPLSLMKLESILFRLNKLHNVSLVNLLHCPNKPIWSRQGFPFCSKCISSSPISSLSSAFDSISSICWPYVLFASVEVASYIILYLHSRVPG